MVMKKNRSKIISLLFFIPLMAITLLSQDKEQLIIFHAGSLTIPFDQIITAFQKENPNVEIVKEIAGSRECARKITELHKDCDIMASADYRVIDNLLIPEYADWNIKFAANEMAIVYTEHSKKANKINADNWMEILLDKDINYGRSEPNSDPCGYRTILTAKLAEKYYKIPGFAAKLLSKDNEYIRPKEVDLLALLEVGELDYIFLYRSVAEQHGLKYLLLPDEINLKKSEYEELYKQVSTELNGKCPGEKITVKGEAMVYGITIPKNSPNRITAMNFLKFLLDKSKGLAILEQNGQPSLVPSYCETYSKLPDELKKYATDMKK